MKAKQKKKNRQTKKNRKSSSDSKPITFPKTSCIDSPADYISTDDTADSTELSTRAKKPTTKTTTNVANNNTDSYNKRSEHGEVAAIAPKTRRGGAKTPGHYKEIDEGESYHTT